jgi:CRP-like cAMP-binding protein
MIPNALNTTKKLRTLSACPVFSKIPCDQLSVLAEMMTTENLRSGETLFECDDPSDRVYIVVSGSLDVFLPGRAERARILGPNKLLGEYGMFAGMARTATVKAQTDAVLLSLDYPRFRAFLLRFPEATLVLLQTAVERLVAAEKHG